MVLLVDTDHLSATSTGFPVELGDIPNPEIQSVNQTCYCIAVLMVVALGPACAKRTATRPGEIHVRCLLFHKIGCSGTHAGVCAGSQHFANSRPKGTCAIGLFQSAAAAAP